MVKAAGCVYGAVREGRRCCRLIHWGLVQDCCLENELLRTETVYCEVCKAVDLSALPTHGRVDKGQFVTS